MEVQRNFTKDKIVVTASPDEWQDVISQLLRMVPSNEASEKLVNWLINQGVFDQ